MRVDRTMNRGHGEIMNMLVYRMTVRYLNPEGIDFATNLWMVNIYQRIVHTYTNQ